MSFEMENLVIISTPRTRLPAGCEIYLLHNSILHIQSYYNYVKLYS